MLSAMADAMVQRSNFRSGVLVWVHDNYKGKSVSRDSIVDGVRSTL